MFRPDGGIIEPSRHRMGQFNLAFFVGEQESFRSLKHAEASALKTGRMFAAANAFATGFNADHSNISILQERMEQADGIAAPADAGDEQIRQPFFAFANLAARLNPNDALKVAHHHWIWVRTED